MACTYVQAPHGPSQQALITSAMQRAGVSFLPYVSSHGTGTPLGDPIETGALRKAIAPDMAGTGSQVFTLGAVKSLTGHLEGTAGLAGLMLCMLQLQQRSDPPLRYQNLACYLVPQLMPLICYCLEVARLRVQNRSHLGSCHVLQLPGLLTGLLTGLQVPELEPIRGRVVVWLGSGAQIAYSGMPSCCA